MHVVRVNAYAYVRERSRTIGEGGDRVPAEGAQLCERQGCGNSVAPPPRGGRAARFCSASCRAAWHRARARAEHADDNDITTLAEQLSAALTAAQRAGTALAGKLAALQPEQLEDLRADLDVALADRDAALAEAAAAASNLQVATGEAQALRDALAAERRLRELLERQAAGPAPPSQ
jgi:hypothetical protein